MLDGLYNDRVYLPLELCDELPDNFRNIYYCKHAKDVARNRGIKLPNSVCGGKIFEIEVVNGKVTKACYRISFNKFKDLSIVVRLDRKFPIVVTVWTNDKDEYPEVEISRYKRK